MFRKIRKLISMFKIRVKMIMFRKVTWPIIKSKDTNPYQEPTATTSTSKTLKAYSSLKSHSLKQ